MNAQGKRLGDENPAQRGKPISQIYPKWNTSDNLPHTGELSGLISISGAMWAQHFLTMG